MYISFAIIKEIFRRILISKDIKQENILSSWNAVVDYLKVHMGDNSTEQFRVLFLNKKNILIADEIQTHGRIWTQFPTPMGRRIHILYMCYSNVIKFMCYAYVIYM
jgi:DNA repair protein RadC